MATLVPLQTDLLLPLEVLIKVSSQNPALGPLSRAVLELQLVYYWLKDLESKLESYEQTLEVRVRPPVRPHPPSLLTVESELNYIRERLAAGHTELMDKFITPCTVPTDIMNGLMVCAAKLTDCIYCVILAQNYYEQLTKRPS
jgi:hypothetical protein